MSFKNENFCHVASNNRNNTKIGMFVYRTTDDLATVTTSGYFNEKIIDLKLHDIIIHEQIDSADNTKVKQNFLCVTQKTLSNVTVKIMDTDEVDGANTDLDNLTSTGKANISAQGTYDAGATYEIGTVGAALQSKADAATSANTDLSNLTSTGANIANWSSNVSNCITEIPQDINLTLSNGTLTLSPSKVYVPNGSGIFDVMTSQAQTLTLTSNGAYFLCVRADTGYIDNRLVANSVSGAGATTTAGFAYNTTTNQIRYYTIDGTDAGHNYSFPIAIITVSGGAISSIDQVFNGFGFIGSTVFALPGVKGLIPDGRNADGTLKNIETTISAVQTHQLQNQQDNGLILKANGTIECAPLSNSTQWGYSYDYTNNLIKQYQSGSLVVKQCAIIGNLENNTLTITSLTPKTTFHAVDYNDTEFIAHQAMPSSQYVNLTLPTSGQTVTAPADGYIMLIKSSDNTSQYASMYNNTTLLSTGTILPASGQTTRLFLPVSKGDIVTVAYSLGGATGQFRFVYANGAK